MQKQKTKKINKDQFRFLAKPNKVWLENGFKNQDKEKIWIYGKHSVFSAIQRNRRKIFEILATKNSSSELYAFLDKNPFISSAKSKIKIVDNHQIEAAIGGNKDRHPTHQGLAIQCSKLPIKNQNDLLEELDSVAENELPTLLLLDQISDPQNVGAIIRSAAGFGIKKIIFCEHNSPKETASIVKSSAGTIDLVDLFVVTNLSNLIEKIKKIGYWCIGLAGTANANINSIKNYKNIALIIGSEGDGIRDLVRKNCDILAKIEISKEVESLNASVAASIAFYELSKNEVLK